MLTRLLLFVALVAVGRAADPARAKENTEAKFTWSDLLPRAFQKNPRLNVALHTETTPAGKKLPAASAQHPVYYILLDRGMSEAGEIVAGERPPPPAKLADLMRNALAASGYQPGTREHPPTIAICYIWGSYNHLDPIDPSESVDLTDPSFLKNVRDRAMLVGGPAFSGQLLRALDQRNVNFFRLSDPRYDEMVDLALGDLYFVLALAFEPDPNHHKELIWTTAICTDSSAMTMDETLPALVSLGQSHFGHETSATLVHPRLYGGHVEIGESVVVPDAPPK